MEISENVVSMAGKLLTAEEILAADDLTHIDVPVPEWTPGYIEGADVEIGHADHVAVRNVRLRVMTADEAIIFATSTQSGDAGKRNELVVTLIAACAIDENGDQLFSQEQVDGLKKKSFVVYQRLQDAVLLLNGFADEDDAADTEKKDSENPAG